MEILQDIPNTGYQTELLNQPQLDKLIASAKFNLMMAHVIIDAVDNYPEMTKESILDINNKKTKRPSLQNNTIYCYCELRKVNEANCKVLQNISKVPENTKTYNVILPGLVYCENNYFPITPPVHKDLYFVAGQKEVGWYNKDNNILWLCDIGHFIDRVANLLEFILQRVREFNVLKRIAILPDLKIGCDCEFEIFNMHNEFVGANHYLDDIAGRHAIIGNEIGLDGHPATGEIRPLHANNPLKLARNIKRTVKKLVYRLAARDPSLKIYCGGGLAEHLGGHIHFNIPDFNINDTALKHVLHDLIGVHIKNSMSQRSIRPQLGQYMSRDATEGFRLATAHVGMEWRYPPSFILNDAICKAILCTTWCVIKEHYGNGFTTDAYSIDAVIPVLRSLELYPYYKIWIEKFIELFMMKKTAMEGIDLKEARGIQPPTHNIRIVSDIEWIRKYFVSTRIASANTISLAIYRTTDMILSTSTRKPLSTELRAEIAEFAANHLVECVLKTSRDLATNLRMDIPWYAPANFEIAQTKFKILLKKIILELDQQ